jgi:hypothetical protein
MKKFYNYTEQLLLTVMPKSDSVGAVDHEVEEKPTDMFNTSAEEILKNIGGDTVQPDDKVGEMGENQSESAGGVEIECMGEEGVKVKFNGLEMLLPPNVVEAIKSHQTEEGSTEEDHEDHEASETPEEEHEEHETEETEENEEKDEDKKKNPFSESALYVQRLIESKKGKAVNPWAVCNKSTGGKKKSGKEKFEKCVKGVKSKHKVKD